jgi:hypothetical protein
MELTTPEQDDVTLANGTIATPSAAGPSKNRNTEPD